MAIYTQSDFERDKKEKGSAFNSLYEKMQALEGSSGNRAAHVAAQETHSKGLRAKGLPDTSIFGTNENPIVRMLGMKNAAQYSTPEGTLGYNKALPQNPMYNYRMQPRQTPSLAQIGPPRQRGMAGSGGWIWGILSNACRGWP
jgi:hypothetical protein